MTGGITARSARRAAVRGAAAGAIAAGALGLAATSVAAYFARRLVTPTPERVDDTVILAVGEGTVTLRDTEDTVAPGRYGLWLDGGAGHARVGPVVDQDLRARTVTRSLLGLDRGELRPGPARWNQYFYAGTPAAALGLPYQDIEIGSELGPMPAWLVPAAAAGASRRWAVLVHGRGATREECLRALPVLQRLGFTSLVVAYRNDRDAPATPRGRYHLGDREWSDVEAAVHRAVEGGAEEVVLVGWSMGAAMALQVASRSPAASVVRGLVLDAPVLDWRAVMAHLARVVRLPPPVGRLGEAMLGHSWAWRLAGVEAPVDFDRLDWVARAEQLQIPLLVLHSEDDELVPCEPSRRLAAARPDLVTFVPSRGARHTKEWNVDPEGWEAAVARFLLTL